MTSKGNCYICGAELGKRAMMNHVRNEHGGEDGGQECRLLKIEGAYNKNMWLLIDLPVEKTLADVDKFLRKIWLECCGHLSQFFGPGHNEVGKKRKLSDFSDGETLHHEYDFGTPTETQITIVGSIRRPSQRNSIRLLARNLPPEYRCATCGQPAECVCAECMQVIDNPFYCAVCSEIHIHCEVLLPVANSPRMGECGYDGELDVFTFDPNRIP